MPTDRTSEPFQLPKLTCPGADALRKLQERIDSGIELRARTFQTEEVLDRANSDRAIWYNRSLVLTRSLFDSSYFYEWFGRAGANVRINVRPASLAELTKEYREKLSAYLTVIQSILDCLDELEEAPSDGVQFNVTPAKQPTTVFVVHGRDDGIRESVARLVERVGPTPVILKEQPNQGRTLIEKFEDYSDVGFAVVLLTGDDQGGLRGQPCDTQKPRARQNVILELGYFLGKLGRDRVCALYESGVEIPTDYLGVAFVELDANARWHLELAREMKAAGLPVDMNKL